MRYENVYLQSIGYELAPNVVTTAALESCLQPLYDRLHMPMGQLAHLTGILERRWWDAGFRPSDGAILAAEKALDQSEVEATDLGAVIYAGVCRDDHEPATACRVADAIGVQRDCQVYDIANACLGVLNGILQLANMIALGQIQAGMVVSCESAREINEIMIDEMLDHLSMDHFKTAIATLTGGSGAVAVIVTDGSFAGDRHRLVGASMRAAPEHHALCRWGADHREPPRRRELMATDAIGVLKNGVPLGVETWEGLLTTLGWAAESVDKVICHQVGSANRESILKAIGVPEAKDFSTFAYTGNMGTAALPTAAAIAHERDFLQSGDRVGFLGIGSGLNCLMLGLEW